MGKEKKIRVKYDHGALGGAYFLTFVGAAVYWINQANGFGEFLVALLKAMVWPAFVMYRALELMGL